MTAAAPTWTRIEIFDPDPAFFDLGDIAGALSRTFRFHSQSAVSVAEHSVLIARAAQPEHARAALMHDAAEAYLGDVPTSLKHGRGFSTYRRLEDQYMRLLAERFDFDFPLPEEIHFLDKRCLRAEAEQLLSPDFAAKLAPRVRPLDVEIKCWLPARAKQKFLAEAARLGIQ